jgi:hypothetical protein
MRPTSCDTRRMDIAASSSVAEISSAVAAPLAGRQADGNTPKRDRRLTLTKIDKRGRLGKRVAELTAMFAAAVHGEQTPMRKLRVEKAAELTAMAEQVRGDYMRDGNGTLDDIVRIERKADQAVRSLGITDAKPKSKLSIPEYLAQRDARRAQGV